MVAQTGARPGAVGMAARMGVHMGGNSQWWEGGVGGDCARWQEWRARMDSLGSLTGRCRWWLSGWRYKVGQDRGS